MAHLEERVHQLDRQLDTEERCGLSKVGQRQILPELTVTHVRRYGPRHGRSKAMVEPFPPTLGHGLAHTIDDTLVRAFLGGLELGLDCVGGEGDTPHGNTGGGTGGNDGGDGEFVRARGFEGVFDEFVGDKVAASGTSMYVTHRTSVPLTQRFPVHHDPTSLWYP